MSTTGAPTTATPASLDFSFDVSHLDDLGPFEISYADLEALREPRNERSGRQEESTTPHESTTYSPDLETLPDACNERSGRNQEESTTPHESTTDVDSLIGDLGPSLETLHVDCNEASGRNQEEESIIINGQRERQEDSHNNGGLNQFLRPQPVPQPPPQPQPQPTTPHENQRTDSPNATSQREQQENSHNNSGLNLGQILRPQPVPPPPHPTTPHEPTTDSPNGMIIQTENTSFENATTTTISTAVGPQSTAGTVVAGQEDNDEILLNLLVQEDRGFRKKIRPQDTFLNNMRGGTQNSPRSVRRLKDLQHDVRKNYKSYRLSHETKERKVEIAVELKSKFEKTGEDGHDHPVLYKKVWIVPMAIYEQRVIRKNDGKVTKEDAKLIEELAKLNFALLYDPRILNTRIISDEEKEKLSWYRRVTIQEIIDRLSSKKNRYPNNNIILDNNNDDEDDDVKTTTGLFTFLGKQVQLYEGRLKGILSKMIPNIKVHSLRHQALDEYNCCEQRLKLLGKIANDRGVVVVGGGGGGKGGGPQPKTTFMGGLRLIIEIPKQLIIELGGIMVAPVVAAAPAPAPAPAAAAAAAATQNASGHAALAGAGVANDSVSTTAPYNEGVDSIAEFSRAMLCVLKRVEANNLKSLLNYLIQLSGLEGYEYLNESPLHRIDVEFHQLFQNALRAMQPASNARKRKGPPSDPPSDSPGKGRPAGGRGGQPPPAAGGRGGTASSATGDRGGTMPSAAGGQGGLGQGNQGKSRSGDEREEDSDESWTSANVGDDAEYESDSDDDDDDYSYDENDDQQFAVVSSDSDSSVSSDGSSESTTTIRNERERIVLFYSKMAKAAEEGRPSHTAHVRSFEEQLRKLSASVDSPEILENLLSKECSKLFVNLVGSDLNPQSNGKIDDTNKANAQFATLQNDAGSNHSAEGLKSKTVQNVDHVSAVTKTSSKESDFADIPQDKKKSSKTEEALALSLSAEDKNSDYSITEEMVKQVADMHGKMQVEIRKFKTVDECKLFYDANTSLHELYQQSFLKGNIDSMEAGCKRWALAFQSKKPWAIYWSHYRRTLTYLLFQVVGLCFDNRGNILHLDTLLSFGAKRILPIVRTCLCLDRYNALYQKRREETLEEVVGLSWYSKTDEKLMTQINRANFTGGTLNKRYRWLFECSQLGFSSNKDISNWYKRWMTPCYLDDSGEVHFVDDREAAQLGHVPAESAKVHSAAEVTSQGDFAGDHELPPDETEITKLAGQQAQ